MLSTETNENNFHDDNKKIIKGLRKSRTLNILFVRLFVVLAFSFLVISLIIPLRPKYSESEKRNLASFPKLTLSSFFSGDFFDGINLWFSDTFPFRENMVSANAAITGFYGKNDVRIHGEVIEGDEIPDSADLPKENNSNSSSDGNSDSGSSDSSSSATNSSSSDASSNASSSEPQQPAVQTLGALLIDGDTAYEYYNFVKSIADEYMNGINNAAEMLYGKARVFDIVVPTSMGITAPDELLKNVNTSDQKKAIDYIYSGLSDKVTKVNIYDILKEHKNEYIYFRTDHHWTARGAYYAYRQLMASKGIPPADLSRFTEMAFPGYLGSFYNSSNKLPQLAANPDTVYAYVPSWGNAAKIRYRFGDWRDTEIITDQTNSPSKYLTFIKGDHPITLMVNPNIQDNSFCIVIKESFGNAFVPFLTENYSQVYVLDYRYFAEADERGLVQFVNDCGENPIDVIFINNISATRSRELVRQINSLIR